MQARQLLRNLLGASKVSQNSDKSSSPSPESKAKPKVKVPVLKLGWSDVELLVEACCARMQIRRYDGILAVARGGLVPAAMIAHRLGIRQLQSVQSIFYEHTHCGKVWYDRLPTLKWHADTAVGPGILVVDDIYDTGNTLLEIGTKAQFGGYCTLVAKDTDNIFKRLLVTGMWVPNDVWVEFPWER